jgi:hypothetical protein
MQDENVRDATLRILQNIQSQLGELRAQVDRLESNMAVQFDEVRTELTGEIQGVRTELKGEIQSVRTELKGEIQSVRTELKGEMQSLRDEMRVGFKASFKQNDRRFLDHEGRLRALERRR